MPSIRNWRTQLKKQCLSQGFHQLSSCCSSLSRLFQNEDRFDRIILLFLLYLTVIKLVLELKFKQNNALVLGILFCAKIVKMNRMKCASANLLPHCIKISL